MTREWGQKNRDTVLGFLRAWLKAGAWVKDPANREAAIKLVGAELKLNPKQAAESVDELSTTGNLNLPGLQVVLDLRNQFGFKLPKGISCRCIMTCNTSMRLKASKAVQKFKGSIGVPSDSDLELLNP